MKAICYRNTKTNIPRWVNTLHVEQKYGYAYETPTHFVHFYGKEPFYIISVGLTAIEGKAGYSCIEDWVKERFGAEDIKEMIYDVGHTIEGVWRPSLYYWDDSCSALRIDMSEQVSQEQAIRLLVQKLDKLLFYIEPSLEGLESYSHKTRDLLILSCTEVENQWRSFLLKSNTLPQNGRNYTTNDYIKLLNKLYLNDFKIKLRNNLYQVKISPFATWSASNPTASLAWYEAYNKTKHDRYNNFSQAKLRYVIDSIVANIVLYAVRYSPLVLINNTNDFSATINQLFSISMENVDIRTFYLPEIETPENFTSECFVYDSYQEGLNKEWIVDPLVL